jgi:hypothetical protein
MALHLTLASMKRWLAPLAWAVSSLACGSTRLDDSLTDAPTRLRVEPDLFEGDVACLPGTPGALQSYVVSFTQVSFGNIGVDAGPPPPTVSSPPVPCDRSVLFTAFGGRSYAADIVGFDRDVSPDEAASVAPVWSASCGRGTPDLAADAGTDPLGPTVAIFNYTVPMLGCTSFVAAGGAAESSRLVVDQASALGQLKCGSGKGKVSRFEGTLGGNRVSAACGEPLEFVVQNAAPVFHTVSLTAFEDTTSGTDAGAAVLDAGTLAPVGTVPSNPDAGVDAGTASGVDTRDAGSPDAGTIDAGASGGVARWRTQCIGRAVPGVSATATCDPLVSISP